MELTWSTDRWSVSSGLPDSPISDKNRVTTFVYDGLNNVTKQVAHTVDDQDNEVVQVTEYVYGVNTDTDDNPLASAITSNDLLGSVTYPAEQSNDPAGPRTVFYAYNRQGEVTRWKTRTTRCTPTRVTMTVGSCWMPCPSPRVARSTTPFWRSVGPSMTPDGSSWRARSTRRAPP